MHLDKNILYVEIQIVSRTFFIPARLSNPAAKKK